MASIPEITIIITDVTKTGLCVTPDDGQRVFDAVAKALERTDRVRLSFKDVTRLTTAFLNPALGQLYGAFGEKIFVERIECVDTTKADEAIIRKTIDNAIKFFKIPEAVKAARNEILGKDDGSS